MDTRFSGTRSARGDVTIAEKTSGKKPRRTFTPEYQHEAARLVIDTGRAVADVTRELNVAPPGRWASGSPPSEPLTPGEPTGELTLDERAELKASRRQVEDLHKDNEFPGKAATFFASLADDRRTVRTDGRVNKKFTGGDNDPRCGPLQDP
nr:hypothetical protein [Corynebacterium provencense]